MELKRVGIDMSKAVFTVHGIDAQERAVLRRNLSRAAFEAFCAKLAPTEVALEACGGSYHWARVLSAMGHRVRLIPAQYVKPFVKRGKNDRNHAEALMQHVMSPQAGIPEAAQRMLAVLAGQLAQVDAEIAALDKQMREAAMADPVARRLMKVPSIAHRAAMGWFMYVPPTVCWCDQA